ncbi:MAG TPA: CADD family putative folate metabolism protein [Acidobacteriaceae bacterium]|nr:CADD family putative folate metabolism protein [Acidobacteriaceae bacterium]
MSATQTFIDRLEARIAPFDLLTHPFYRAWTAGELTPEDLRAYAAEYWHHVSAFPTYLSALHARMEDTELRRVVLRNLLDEEGIGSPDGKPHSQLWMDFANGMGASESEVRTRTLQPESEALISNFRNIAQQGNTAAALAAFYAYESKVPAIAREKAAGLQQHYAADAATCRYFTLHQTADVHHARVWQQAIGTELERDSASAEVALDAAETTAKALWSALDGVERLRQQHRVN